uniref:Uncharacterized protein n=1 Tax=Trichogramma kaykai TaxID=54128 RepID=A0ABD2WD17_9HYME
MSDSYKGTRPPPVARETDYENPATSEISVQTGKPADEQLAPDRGTAAVTPGLTRESSLKSSLKARLSCKRVLITALKLPTT